MTFKDIVARNRSYRRFRENATISEGTLRELVEMARQSPSARNAQPLKYVLSCGSRMNARIYETLSWAGALKDWAGPEPGERPAAYVVILLDTGISANVGHDAGIAAQSILLGAVERGLGGCMIASIRRSQLADTLSVPAGLEISLVIALGEPVETVVLEDAPEGGPVTYYREPDGTHHVPKRRLEEIVIDVYTE